MQGRLRDYGSDKYTFYFDMLDIGFPQVEDMFKKRLRVFKKKCAQIINLKTGNK
ncbi:hypothetical protein D3C71_2192810 [compost metagenome]